jgi:hypothetical protein
MRMTVLAMVVLLVIAGCAHRDPVAEERRSTPATRTSGRSRALPCEIALD